MHTQTHTHAHENKCSKEKCKFVAKCRLGVEIVANGIRPVSTVICLPYLLSPLSLLLHLRAARSVYFTLFTRLLWHSCPFYCYYYTHNVLEHCHLQWAIALHYAIAHIHHCAPCRLLYSRFYSSSFYLHIECIFIQEKWKRRRRQRSDWRTAHRTMRPVYTLSKTTDKLRSKLSGIMHTNWSKFGLAAETIASMGKSVGASDQLIPIDECV